MSGSYIYIAYSESEGEWARVLGAFDNEREARKACVIDMSHDGIQLNDCENHDTIDDSLIWSVELECAPTNIYWRVSRQAIKEKAWL